MIYKLSNFLIKHYTKRKYCTDFGRFKPPWKVLFFGTDQFSLASLKLLNIEYKKKTLIDKLEVVTSFKNKLNPVYQFGIEEKLVLHRWPLENEIKGFDVGLVVSFGYLLPEKIINSFPLGMLNVHASLLPRWRGAAPIIYSLANGDCKTGISIMRIKPKHFDVGEIIEQSEIEVSDDKTLPVLYKELSELGAKVLISSLWDLPRNLSRAKPQSEIGVSFAPKIDASFAEVKFNEMSARKICNLSRALEGLYPCTTHFNNLVVKLFKIKMCDFNDLNEINRPGFVFYDKNEKVLKVKCKDGKFVSVEKVGLHNKKVMSAADFNNGFLKKEEENNRLFN